MQCRSDQTLVEHCKTMARINSQTHQSVNGSKRGSFSCITSVMVFELIVRSAHGMLAWHRIEQGLHCTCVFIIRNRTLIQGTSKIPYLSVNKMRNNCLCLPTAGRKTQLLLIILTEPGKGILEVPCARRILWPLGTFTVMLYPNSVAQIDSPKLIPAQSVAASVQFHLLRARERDDPNNSPIFPPLLSPCMRSHIKEVPKIICTVGLVGHYIQGRAKKSLWHMFRQDWWAVNRQP